MGPDTQTTDAPPIGRIPDADTTPGSQSVSTALPTLNPTDSPYQPLNLPTEEPKQAPPLPERQQDPNLGATSKTGAVAYLADQVLRGAMQGYDFAQQKKADQFNKKLAAQQSIYNDQAKQLHDMAVAGVDPNSKEFKDAQNRVLASWQATMNTIGERIPQPKKSSKSKQGQQDGTDQSSLLARALNHKNDPQDALQAVYQGAIATGPPVFHQIQPYLSPAYQAQKRQGAQTQASQATTQATTADTQAQVADINNKLAHAVQSGASQDQIDALIRQRDELAPSQKFPVGGLKRSGQGADGKWYEWQEDQEGKEIPNTRRPLSTAGLGAKAPKLGWTKVDGKWGSQNYDPETNQPIPGTFDSTKVPPANVLALYPSEHTLTGKFVDSNGVLQTYSTTTTSERALPPGLGNSGSSSASPRTMVTPNPKGLVEPGNIPIDNRPTVKNADGSHSTEYSVSFNQDGKEVLVPTVVGGKFLTPDGKKPKEGSPEEKAMFKAAWQHYLDTGENLGKFDSPANADAYAEQLHNRGAISHQPKTAAPSSGTAPPTSQGSGTKPIGYVGSASYKAAVKQATDAQKDFNNASTNLSTMLKTAAEAKQGNGAAQVGILAAYLKTVVGGQGSGLRITKAEWDAATQTRPFLKGIEAKFSPDGYMSGAAIAPSQVDQMVNEVHQKTKALYDTTQSAKQRVEDQRKADMQAGGLGAKPAPKTPSTTPQTHVFDSAAWKAANPKGDVEAAKAQAKAQGYEVR